jgi:hypothetical protein
VYAFPRAVSGVPQGYPESKSADQPLIRKALEFVLDGIEVQDLAGQGACLFRLCEKLRVKRFGVRTAGHAHDPLVGWDDHRTSRLIVSSANDRGVFARDDHPHPTALVDDTLL